MPPSFDPPLTNHEVMSAIPGVTVAAQLPSGGQGAVFKVLNPDGRVGALKVYGLDTVVARVEREVDELTKLTSPHIVSLISHGSASIRGATLRYAIMDFIEGEELTTKCGHLDDSDIRRLLRDASRGIECLWARRLVHRDIKPNNIMSKRDDGYVIIDLGLAKHLDRSQLTQYGWVCGTAGYMSPEQASGRVGLTFRSDLYSLGITAYQAASGCHPFGGFQHLIGAIDPPQLHTISSVSIETSGIIHQLLKPFPLDRPRSCREVYEAL